MTPDNPEVSQARLLANLANSLQSTGPKTEAGKAKSRMNAWRHGLTGQFSVMSEDDRIAYLAFEKDYLQALAPVGPIERQLAITIAQHHWRLNRARALESNIDGLGHHDFADDVDANTPQAEFAVTQAKTWLRSYHALANLALYETRLQRLLVHAEKRLEELQTARKAAEAKALEEAQLLLRQSLMNRERLDPAQELHIDGFVFSAASVLAGINRKRTLAAARFHEKNGWDPKKTFSESQPLSFSGSGSLPKAA